MPSINDVDQRASGFSEDNDCIQNKIEDSHMMHAPSRHQSRPIPYRPDPTGSPDFWRCAHFHLLAICPRYRPLITEIHFQDDPKKNDPRYRAVNAIAVEDRTVNGKAFQTGVFDVVLERES